MYLMTLILDTLGPIGGGVLVVTPSIYGLQSHLMRAVQVW
jgi:hypothetical protein